MSSKPPGPFPPPGTLKAKLVNFIPRTNVIVYRLSKGRLGGHMQDLPVLILHTVGRKTGKPRQSPLLYIQDGDIHAVVGSRGGSDAPPAWWLNLQAKSEATIEIKGTKRPVSARIATPEEKALYWPRLVAGYPFYNDYQARTAREIPVIVLSNERNP
ncbi:MAG TPA: nitroreductase family deazaflavin-dependent oxidoreductase [Solirubrobacteraceae bacterium]|nr:nitroreductase family deazaflavin-dependent oxidoreductase [Solirubrobacteraceae bacterium]